MISKSVPIAPRSGTQVMAVALITATAGCATASGSPLDQLRAESLQRPGVRDVLPARPSMSRIAPVVEPGPLSGHDAKVSAPAAVTTSLTPTSATTAAVTSAEAVVPARHTDVAEAKGIIEFLFGHSDPVLRCTVLRVCVIELEPGETLADEPIAGDQERWIITRARNGRGGTKALIVVKPKACDIATNLVLSTDRRIYNIDLESPPCRPRDTNPRQAYTRRIRFSYPDDTGLTRADGAGRALTDAAVTLGSPTPAAGESTGLPVPTNREYRVVRGRRGPFGLLGTKPVDFPWTPTAIADDGAHVYITLPPSAKQHAAPVLYALEDDGSRTMLNFTMRDSVIVTDRTFRHGLFVIVSGSRERTLTFENRAWLKAREGGRP